MAQIVQIVKEIPQRIRGRLQDAYEWFECHPKTIAWLTFWLAVNYVVDIITGVWPF